MFDLITAHLKHGPQRKKIITTVNMIMAGFQIDICEHLILICFVNIRTLRQIGHIYISVV